MRDVDDVRPLAAHWGAGLHEYVISQGLELTCYLRRQVKVPE